ncbi:MAG TPA: cupredoxin domain-containing protein [Gaiellaceae bacterium]|nr:cupredoxin domain-containing protein [Gaiellaceae bacterium]
MRGVVVVAVPVTLVALAAAGCGGSSKSGSSSTSESGGGGQKTIAGVKANDHGSKNVSGEAEVELDDFYFEPTVLRGKPGSQVTIKLKNEGSTEHNFTIDAQKIDKDVEAGEDAEVTVTFPKSGVLSFYCKYHKSMGMAGALAAGGTGAMTGSGGTTTEETTTQTSTGKGY